jgi:hypothetical protein
MRRLLIACLVVFWVNPPAFGESRPLCANCTTGETIQSRFPPSEGYARVSVPPESFAAWLRQLPLLPPNSDARDWRGHLAMTADEVAAVLDWRLLGSAEQCADIAVRLVAEYALGNGERDQIAFRSLSGQAIKWKKWLQGDYAIVRDGSAVVYEEGSRRRDTSREFDAYLKFVMAYVNTASLVRDWPEVEFAKIRIGDVLIQPSQSPNGLGHLSVVIDACTTASGEFLFLFTDGFTPARAPVVRAEIPGDPDSVWMTPPVYLELMSQFGPGAFHRPPAWIAHAAP